MLFRSNERDWSMRDFSGGQNTIKVRKSAKKIQNVAYIIAFITQTNKKIELYI